MTGKSLKHHYALIPLFVIMAIGMAFVAAFCGRLAIYSPDTNWTRYIYYRLFFYTFMVAGVCSWSQPVR